MHVPEKFKDAAVTPGDDEFAYMTLRSRWASIVMQRWLIGTLLNAMIGFTLGFFFAFFAMRYSDL